MGTTQRFDGILDPNMMFESVSSSSAGAGNSLAHHHRHEPWYLVLVDPDMVDEDVGPQGTTQVTSTSSRSWLSGLEQSVNSKQQSTQPCSQQVS